jgi:hypothetical protein
MVALATLAGCAHNWDSVIDGRVYTRTNLYRYPVRIVSVDGEYSTLEPRRVSAGEHRLVVDAAPVAGFHLPDRREFTFRTEKCVKYWLVAQRASALSHDFELVIDHAEPVPGCNPTSGAPDRAVVVVPATIEPPRAIPMPKRP